MGSSESSKIHVEESILGVFGIGENNEIVEKTLYQPDPKEIAGALSKQLNGELTREVDETIEKLVKRGFKKLIFTNRALANSIRNRRGVDVEVVARSDTGEYLRANIEALAMKFGGNFRKGPLPVLDPTVRQQ